MSRNVQNVSQHTDSPHVSVEANRFMVGDLWSSKLSSSCGNFDDLLWIELRRQTEVDQFHVSTLLLHAHYVLRLTHVQQTIYLARFCVGAGATAPEARPYSPKCDMKHCLTNLKHQHIGAKRSVLWPSKYAKIMHFRPGLRPRSSEDLMTLPRPLIGWKGTPLPIPHHSVPHGGH